MFVAASVGSGVYTPDKHHALRAFLSPTVMHFSSVLVACLIIMTPIHRWTLLGLLVGADGLIGFVYAASVWRGMKHHGLLSLIDREDYTFYAICPVFGHVITVVAGILLLLRLNAGFGILALAIAVLLLVGIRNGWDMTLWTVMRPRNNVNSSKD
ncbi:hypothetical protein [Rhodopila sp.]|uniref:hypothetical protein n=1 Tax=Rhodopila sp. TaxID=2480087 RepID=UPI003D14F048